MGSACPTCGVGEPWNRYSYHTTDGEGQPLVVYTDSVGDGDRDECEDPWHDTAPAPAPRAEAETVAVPRAEYEAMRDALRFYANEDNYRTLDYSDFTAVAKIKTDRGLIARAALRGAGDDKKGG